MSATASSGCGGMAANGGFTLRRCALFVVSAAKTLSDKIAEGWVCLAL